MRVLCLIFTFLALCQSTHQRKNVLLIIVDDLRPELGVYQDESNQFFKDIHTPNMDQLASRSFVAKRAYVQQAICSPSRASFLTGRRPDTTKTYGVPENYRELGGNFTSLPQYFKENGYITAGFGKVFHHAAKSRDIDEPSWTEPFFKPPFKGNWATKQSWSLATKERREKEPLADESSASAAIDTLNRLAPGAKNGSQPFMMVLGFEKPHLSLTFPEEILDLYPEEKIQLPSNPYAPRGIPRYAWSKWHELRGYEDIKEFGCSGNMNDTLPDDMVGRVLEALDEEGLAEDTIIALIGDHGYMLGEHGAWVKHSNFDLATRAPFMISIPGVTEDMVLSEEMVEFVDLFPTLIEAVGLDNAVVMPVLTNETSIQWKDRAFSQYPRTLGNIKRGIMGYSMVTKTHRYSEWNGFDPSTITPNWDANYGIELYDLQNDPEENVNVWDDPEYAEVIIEMSLKLRDGWRAALPSKNLDDRNTW
ncbi:hypothetical protein CAPTEDRAFT_207092 [Capitella teleta]|uniref:Sulfatase N-terminal domain-containing protein n=1 Tax=Capitella teleta TaxID=283909 RepID=R7VL94_CAPTE|nr:hypothetical protein CAPTEDRAFT_207092 [Capitella teleta]|eukprot:ELU17425.1 hypothetical protein CAPTEDRAFT_207092 [Capitella teleta]